MRRGFTLLELSIVLTIIAAVTAMGFSSGIAVISTARQSATAQKMKTIDQALLAYRVANDRLPCPADLTLTAGSANYGIEAANPGTCTGGTPTANFSGIGATNTAAIGAEGAVPTVTLGLPNDFMYDGWGNRFRYAVDVSVTATSAFPAVPLGCTTGAITVNDATGTARSTSSIYALISHGANGHGAYTGGGHIQSAGSVNAAELTNCHCTSTGASATYAPTYVQQDYTPDPANPLDNYDDLVTNKERWQMPTQWDTAACTPQYIYVADAGNNRVEKVTTSGTYLSQFPCASGACSSGTANLYFPEGMAMDSGGNVWLADTFNNRAVKFNSSGTFLMGIGAGYNGVSGSIGSSGTGNGQFNEPIGIAIDGTGNVWIADKNNRVQKFNSSGTYLSQLGCASGACTSGTGNGQFNEPGGIAIDASGNLWVADIQNSRVEKFNSSGTYLSQLGCASGACSNGTGNGQFTNPECVTIDSGGNIWVADTYNNRVQKFNSSGTFLMGIGAGYNGVSGSIGSSGTGNGQFQLATGLAIDSGGNIWVTDDTGNRVQKFNSSGTYLSQLGCASGACSNGTGNGQLYSPRAIVIGNQ